MLSLLKYEVVSRWGAVVGWGAALSLFGVMYVAIYPEFEGKMSAFADISIYKTMGYDLNSFEGFMASSLVLNIPLMLGIYVIMASTATLAGEDESGTLELVVTTQLKRWHIVVVKAIALVVVSFSIFVIAGASSALAMMGMKSVVEVEVTATQLFFAILSGLPLMLAVIMIGLFFSAVSPNRRIAVIATTVIYLVGYLGEMLANTVESLDALKPFLLFCYFDSSAGVFTEGVQARDVGVLLGVAAVFFALALLSFQRRDITVGQWPWQRAMARRAMK